MSARAEKPLGGKAYGSIGHLPGSRMGTGDHHVHEGQARVCLEKTRDKHDRIVVQEKTDGSCVSVALLNGQLLALSRAGYLAMTSPYEQHWLFDGWVRENEQRFRNLLDEGERACGEWLAMAHGTRYELPHEPFVLFDIMEGQKRQTAEHVAGRAGRLGFTTPRVLSDGPPMPMEAMLEAIATSGHGAIDPVEGAVYRVERFEAKRGWYVDFLAKYVRHDKADGCYLPQISGKPAIWLWQPGASS